MPIPAPPLTTCTTSAVRRHPRPSRPRATGGRRPGTVAVVALLLMTRSDLVGAPVVQGPRPISGAVQGPPGARGSGIGQREYGALVRPPSTPPCSTIKGGFVGRVGK